VVILTLTRVAVPPVLGAGDVHEDGADFTDDADLADDAADLVDDTRDDTLDVVVAASSRPGITAAAVGRATSAAATPRVRDFTEAILSYGAEVRRHGSPPPESGETTLVPSG
jgi:hypothetical protein